MRVTLFIKRYVQGREGVCYLLLIFFLLVLLHSLQNAFNVRVVRIDSRQRRQNTGHEISALLRWLCLARRLQTISVRAKIFKAPDVSPRRRMWSESTRVLFIVQLTWLDCDICIANRSSSSSSSSMASTGCACGLVTCGSGLFSARDMAKACCNNSSSSSVSMASAAIITIYVLVHYHH